MIYGMVHLKILALLVFGLAPFGAAAQDRNFTLSAPAAIVESGFLKHLLPRFSLKHGVRITVVESAADVAIGDEGIAVFSGLGSVWHVSRSDDPGPVLFIDWLASDVGKRTIEAFKPDGNVLFSAEIAAAAPSVAVTITGDVVLGETLALAQCGRCHVINETNIMKGMGQTPSFGLMRTFPDWENRFSTFYVLNPHPSFTQVVGVTPPFPANLPPAIVPIEITQTQLDAIVAYVATIAPADLGAPIQSQ